MTSTITKIVSIHFVMLFIFLLVYSCDFNWNKHKATTYYLGQEYKDYAVYNIGSYWVYEDSASKSIDSIYLFSQSFSISDSHYNRPEKLESVEERKYSSLKNDTLVAGGGIVESSKGGVYTEYRLNYNMDSNINYFEGQINDYAALTNNTIYHTKEDSIVFDQKFYHIKVFKNNYQEYAAQPQKTYYARHVGLIRKELFNGQVWNLIRYKVSQ